MGQSSEILGCCPVPPTTAVECENNVSIGPPYLTHIIKAGTNRGEHGFCENRFPAIVGIQFPSLLAHFGVDRKSFDQQSWRIRIELKQLVAIVVANQIKAADH